MLYRVIVKKYSADLILLTKFKKDNWYEGKICAKCGGTSFTYGIFTPNKESLVDFFSLKFYI